jgi:hypothetical protein
MVYIQQNEEIVARNTRLIRKYYNTDLIKTSPDSSPREKLLFAGNEKADALARKAAERVSILRKRDLCSSLLWSPCIPKQPLRSHSIPKQHWNDCYIFLFRVLDASVLRIPD